MPLSTCQTRIGQISGLLCGIQGTVWFIFSLLCLIYYYKDLTIMISNDISFISAFYLRFLSDDYLVSTIYSDDVIIEPSSFTAFNWLYVVFNFCWMVLSFGQAYEIAKDGKKLYRTVRSFAFNTLVISVMDLILVISIGIDYNKTCTKPISELNDTLCQKAVIPMIIIAAKGVILWIMNVVFAYQMQRIGSMLKREAVETSTSVSELDQNDLSSESPAYTVGDDIDNFTPRRGRYVYEYRYAYRPTHVTRYNALTNQHELVYEQQYRLDCDLVWKDF